MGKTSSEVKNRYNAKVYDRINLTIKKGNKEALQAIADSCGESVNAFINTAIEQRIKSERPGAEYAFSDRGNKSESN